MINMTELRETFNRKLSQTDSLDAAFTKAVWTAYKAGLSDAENGVTLADALNHVQLITKSSESVFAYLLEKDDGRVE